MSKAPTPYLSHHHHHPVSLFFTTYLNDVSLLLFIFLLMYSSCWFICDMMINLDEDKCICINVFVFISRQLDNMLSTSFPFDYLMHFSTNDDVGYRQQLTIVQGVPSQPPWSDSFMVSSPPIKLHQLLQGCLKGFCGSLLVLCPIKAKY